jgi:hypothetical protein
VYSTDQQIISAMVARRMGNPKPRRSIALGVKIDHQNAVSNGRKGGRQINCCRRLADATLLVGND